MTTVIESQLQLPRIVRFLGTEDCGDARCPHCGSSGRWIVRFLVEDGRVLGAMRGCVKLYPVSELARRHAHLVDKQARYAAKQPPWALNRRDTEALRWIEDAIDGRADPRQALAIADSARRAAASKHRR